MKRIALFGVLVLMLSGLVEHAALAVPAWPGIHNLRQPDGTTIQARQRGDEWNHWFETLQGVPLVQDRTGRWVPGTRPPLRKPPRPQTPAGVQRIRTRGTKGTESKVPVLCINYNDRTTSYTTTQIRDNLFANSGKTMRTFYTEASYGNFTVNAGTGVGGWYVAANGHDYYENSAAELVREAVQKADAAGYNFAQYDNNGDGYVDVVAIVHQGAGYEFGYGDGHDIWSHSSTIWPPETVDGVQVSSYIIQPERRPTWYDSGLSTVGVFCHEYGHALGLPDFYDYGYDSEGLGAWSLMAGGSWNGPSGLGDSPAQVDAWSRVSLGFVTPIVVTTDQTPASIPRVNDSAIIYKVAADLGSTTEYFLVENRQQVGFDQYIPGNGLCIYHCDDNVYGNDSQWYPGLDPTQHYQVALEQADGLWDMEHYSNSGDTGDPYPGSSTNRTFNAGSTPNSEPYTTPPAHVSIQDISNSGDTMTANIYPDGVGPPTNPGKPDLWIRNAGDTSWLGNNIYNADGTSQTKAQTVAQGVAATYQFRIYNDGDATESFRLFGPAGGAGWTVSYYISGVGEKTSDFLGAGYLVSDLAVGAYVQGWVNVMPGSSVPSGGQQVVLITGKSVTDPTELDAVKAVTTKRKLRPDLWIRNEGDASWVGNNIYNADGSSQTKTQTVAQDVVATYYFRIYNDGNVTDSFRLTGPAAGSGWTVSYYISGVGEKTSDFTGGGYLASSLAVGAYVQGWVNVMPGSSVPSGGQQVVLVTAKSLTSPSKLDAVKAVTTKRKLRPDLWVRNDGDASWVGNNIYNADGTGQTKTQAVVQDVIASYDFRIYNDGNVTDSFRLTGPAAGSGWTVSYYIGGVGEKTSDFTGGGYLASSLAVGAYVQGWVNVMPGSSAGPGDTQTVLITGKSLTSPSKLDAVKTVTMKASGSPVLSSLTAVSARAGGTQIVFSLSAPAMVEARIVNLAGRPIRTLCRDQACVAGTNTLLWDARSDAGLRVPNGTYLIQVTAKGPAGATSRALQAVVIGR